MISIRTSNLLGAVELSYITEIIKDQQPLNESIYQFIFARINAVSFFAFF